MVKVGALLAGGGTLLWWLALLASPDVRSHPALVWTVVLLVSALASVRATAGTRSDPWSLVVVGTVAAVCLMVFGATVGTYALSPQLVPDIAGTACCAGGLTPADRQETNRIESTDPYISVLLVGAAAGALLAAGTVRRRVRGKAMTASHAIVPDLRA